MTRAPGIFAGLPKPSRRSLRRACAAIRDLVRFGAVAWLSLQTDLSVARAFSDPERFTTATDEGGSGGRFFTGAPGDGLSCAVCHQGASAPEVVIRGLPVSGYEPDELYDAELRFAEPAGNHALTLEVVDASGGELGLELLPEAQIAASERCGAERSERRASYLIEERKRRIVGLEACEAEAVRFRFRAPDEGYAFLVASVLASDSSATVDGDGVTEITQPLYENGRPTGADAAKCSVAGPGRARGGVWLLLPALTALLLARRRWQM